MRRILVVLFLVLPLAACGLFISKETRALRKTPDYRAGYSDGCNSAYGPDANKSADNYVRDDEMYRTSRAYRLGWGRGNGACRPSSYNPGNMPGNTVPGGPIPDRNPGGGTIP